jgi:hypothetical protein
MMWIPVNKKTKQHQPAITDAEKAEWLKNEFYASRFTFQAVPGSDKAKAPEPIEAKSFQSKPKEEEK